MKQFIERFDADLPQVQEHISGDPFAKSIICRGCGAQVCLVQRRPLTAGAEDIQDGVGAAAIRHTQATAAKPMGVLGCRRWEYTTTLMDLAPLYHSACIVGYPRQIFEAGVQHIEDERVRNLILDFLNRDPQDPRPEAMGWEVIEGPSGVIYRFGSQPIPEGHL